MFKKLRQLSPIARAISVMGVTGALVTGVTFAALSSTATLTDTSINTANAGLEIYDTPTQAFGAEGQGFTITDLVPGETTGFLNFYLRNTSTKDEKVTAKVDVAPSATGFTGWENLKVVFRDESTGATNAGTFQDLLNNDFDLSGTPLPAGAQGNNTPGAETTPGNYSVSFDIDPAAVTGSSASVGAFDIDFTGTVVATSAP